MSGISIKKATIINFTTRYLNIFIQIILSSILARLLTPSDYGIVAVITVFISFFTMIADMGIGPAIIQNKQLDKREISDIFIFTILIAIGVSVIFILFSYPIACFYNNEVYKPLGMILSGGMFFNVLNIVPNALLLKEKKFKLLGIRAIIITTIGGLVTIVLAMNGFKYYALAINSVLVGLLTFLLNFYSIKLKVHLRFRKKSIVKIREFSTYQFAFNFINYFSRNLDNLLIGRYLGQVALGYYDKAYRLMLYPVQNLTFVITPVLHPILSEYQNEREIIYNQYMKVVKVLSLLGIFFAVFCFFSAYEIILIMFGKQWENSVQAFKFLSISILPQIITSSSGTIFQCTGETKLLFKVGLINSSINIMCIFTGILLDKIEFIAIGISFAYILNFIIAYSILIRKVFKRNLLEFLISFKTDVVIAVIMILGNIIFKFTFNHILISISYKLMLNVGLYWLGLIVTREIVNVRSIIKK